MRFSLFTITLLAVSAMYTACPQASEPSAQADITAAVALHEEAKAEDHGWVVTTKLIAEARAAVAAGNLDDAADLAKRARKTAAASVAQMKKERDAWAARVPGQ